MAIKIGQTVEFEPAFNSRKPTRLKGKVKEIGVKFGRQYWIIEKGAQTVNEVEVRVIKETKKVKR